MTTDSHTSARIGKYEQQVRDEQTCPHCRAQPGNPCVTANNSPARTDHLARYFAYNHTHPLRRYA